MGIISTTEDGTARFGTNLQTANSVHNLQTNEYFTTIQAAIDASNTTDGQTIEVSAGLYNEEVIVNKSLSIYGQGWQNTTINPSGSPHVIYVTANWVNISGFTVTGTYSTPIDSGIWLESVQNCRIENNELTGDWAGVYLVSSCSNSINNNRLLYNDFFGNGEGIRLEYASNNNTVSNNLIMYCAQFGVILLESNDNTIYNNSIIGHTWFGMGLLNNCIGNSIFHNQLMNNAGQAKDDGTNNWDNGYPSGGNYWGDYSGVDNKSGPNQDLSSSDGIGDSNYSISGGFNVDRYPLMQPISPIEGILPHSPIHINSNADFNIAHNVTSGNGTKGNPWIIENLNLSGFVVGSCFYIGNTTEYFKIRNCSFHDASGLSAWWETGYPSGSGRGLVLYNVQNGIIENNYIYSNEFDGSIAYLSSNIHYYNNSFFNNIDRCIDINTSNNCTVEGNTMAYSFVGIGSAQSYFITFVNNSISHYTYGIYPWVSYFFSVNNNKIENGDTGVCLEGCTNSSNMIRDNTISGNSYGVYLSYSSNIFVNNNAIRDNTMTGIAITGFMSNDQNTIVNNSISDNYNGISIGYSYSNEIINNTIVNSTNYGVTIQQSDSNLLYHNNFINNIIQAHNEGSNAWDNGYPSGGNYWSDYIGMDVYSGGMQNIPGADGIGDTPYNITQWSGQDRFPLMTPWGTDITQPNSTVRPPSQYWYRTTILSTYANVTDPESPIANVSLFFHFSADNSSWSNWTLFGIDDLAPWNWSFNFSSGPGYYEFYSVAVDNAGNVEAAPSAADASCAFDPFAPTVVDTSASSATTGDTFYVRASITEAFALAQVQVMYWYGSGSSVIGAMHPGTNNQYELALDIPANDTESLYYQITAVDEAANFNSTLTRSITVSDNDSPIARAGSDQTVNASVQMQFNGSGSVDNVGIANYTWNFTYNGSEVLLYGEMPNYTFWAPGNYTAYLNVSDAVGLWAVDDLTVAVVLMAPPVNNTNNTNNNTNNTQNQTNQTSNFLNDYWWAIAVVALIVVAVAIGVFMLRRKPKAVEASKEEPEDKKEE
ncbi:MAG: right-handed parallel beta-helix repeat-containing protein [Euryarchaeota archaeon]|nr:right-handed parallel beta-helix repeat-containing protein [Euryarchaeota archaeon]